MPADDFANYYSKIFSRIDIQDKNYMLVRFEDFVCDWDKTQRDIMNFLKLNKKNHINPKGFFDPGKSINNIGKYKTFDNQMEILKIERKLKKYCYFKSKTEIKL